MVLELRLLLAILKSMVSIFVLNVNLNLLTSHRAGLKEAMLVLSKLRSVS